MSVRDVERSRNGYMEVLGFERRHKECGTAFGVISVKAQLDRFVSDQIE